MNDLYLIKRVFCLFLEFVPFLNQQCCGTKDTFDVQPAILPLSTSDISKCGKTWIKDKKTCDGCSGKLRNLLQYWDTTAGKCYRKITYIDTYIHVYMNT